MPQIIPIKDLKKTSEISEMCDIIQMNLYLLLKMAMGIW